MCQLYCQIYQEVSDLCGCSQKALALYSSMSGIDWLILASVIQKSLIYCMCTYVKKDSVCVCEKRREEEWHCEGVWIFEWCVLWASVCMNTLWCINEFQLADTSQTSNKFWKFYVVVLHEHKWGG